jgi:hypothetical protein
VRISSPIEYADKLTGHLDRHGMIDDNVFYQVRAPVWRLIELKGITGNGQLRWSHISIKPGVGMTEYRHLPTVQRMLVKLLSVPEAAWRYKTGLWLWESGL